MNYKGGNSKFNPKINLPLRKNDGIINVSSTIRKNQKYFTIIITQCFAILQ